MHPYILTPEAIEAMSGLDKTHFLNANAKRVNKSLGDETGLTHIGFHLIEVPPGCESTELHVHHYEDECVWILDGEAEITIGEQTARVGAGTFVGYPAGGEAHTMRNVGEGVLRCLVAGERRPHDVSDYPRQGLRLYRNEGRAWELVPVEQISNPSAGRKR